ncbi:hypothetical protein AAG570_009979 [Ranatra chinensis]|uniref:Large ribosomal subunit protein uL18m n=1 Tax=Ranatra chinensis TaxID=642074 RepID=A0ABD0YRA0_9HEMI
MQTVLRRCNPLFSFTTPVRLSCSFPSYIYNRNPRNLEKLCIARKPAGYHLERPGKYQFWHSVRLERSSRHITASVIHSGGGSPPVTASTKEWALRRWLYSTNDVGAYSNLGRVLGHRCLATGIQEIHCDLSHDSGHKTQAFIQELEKSGVTLKEPPQYVNPAPSDRERPEKPWLVNEN